jgi:hypothetical protein
MHAFSKQKTATQSSIPMTGGQVAEVGVDYERVDPATCRLIHALFPPHTCGFFFFLGLLANAVAKQYVLPGLPEGTRGDAAIVNVTNGYAGLSRRLRLSYDTTHMYLLIYRALGLLYMEKQGKQTTIIIPLAAYQPPARLAEILGQLKEHYRARRPRVRRLIDNVVERMALLLQAVRQREAPGQLPPLQLELLARVQRVLRAQGVADRGGHIAMSIVTEAMILVASQAEDAVSSQGVQAYLPRLYRGGGSACTALPQVSTPAEERQVAENLPGLVPDEGDEESTASRAVAQGGAPGRFGAENLSTRWGGGTYKPGRTLAVAAYSTIPDRFLAANLPIDQQIEEEAGAACTGHGGFDIGNLPMSQQVVEPVGATPKVAAANLPERVDSSRILPFNGNGIGREKKEKNTPESLPDPVPVPPATSFDEVPSQSGDPLPSADSPVRQQALALARLIEGKEENVGAYVVLLRAHDAHTLKAAVISTLQRKHFPQGKGVLRKPGGFFTRRVQQFQNAIPEQVMAQVQIYAEASYESIDAALATQARERALNRQAPAAASGRLCQPKRGTPMDEATAETLARRIALEDPHVQVRGVSQGQGGAYAVEVYIDPVEYHFCSIRDWEAYHAQMQELEREGGA